MSAPAPAPTPTRTAAARVVDATKVYGSGPTAVVALDEVTVDLEAGRFTAVMGPSGSGKSTLMHCVAGLDALTAGPGLPRRRRARHPVRQGADAAAPRPRRVRVPGVQPGADAVGAGEHRPAPTASPGDRPTPAGSTRWCARSVSATGWRTARPSCRAASSSGSPWPGRWRAGPDIVFADEPTGNLDSRSRRRDPRLPAPGRRRPGPDHRHGHPRPARRRPRRQRAVPGRRAHRRPPGRPDRRPPSSTA